MGSMMFKEKKRLARNEASRALKKYAKMVKKEGLESDRVTIGKPPLEGNLGEEEIEGVQMFEASDSTKYRSRKDNNIANTSDSRGEYNNEGDDSVNDSKELRRKGKQKVKRNPFAKQQRAAEEKAALRAEQQEERRKIQEIIKEKARIREAKKRKFLRQKKPNVGGQIGRLLEKIQQSMS